MSRDAGDAWDKNREKQMKVFLFRLLLFCLYPLHPLYPC
jgi:hypothetical protein